MPKGAIEVFGFGLEGGGGRRSVDGEAVACSCILGCRKGGFFGEDGLQRFHTLTI